MPFGSRTSSLKGPYPYIGILVAPNFLERLDHKSIHENLGEQALGSPSVTSSSVSGLGGLWVSPLLYILIHIQQTK